MIILGIVAAALAIPAALALALGARLPVQHRARASAHYDRPPDEVWRALTDFSDHPNWRRGLKAVERVPEPGGERVKEISGKDEAMTFEVTENAAERRMVRRITDKNLPFGGSWTFEVTPDAGGSRLTITEDGEVYNVVFRFVSKYVMGHHATIKAFLQDLGKKFGADAKVELEK